MAHSDHVTFSMWCYSSRFMEYKLFGNYLLEKIHKALTAEFLNGQAMTILRDHCNTWATCDGLSSKVLRKMIDCDDSGKMASIVALWSDISHSDQIWIQRSSCVSFVCLARHGHFNNLIIEICTRCIQNKERFVQLGVGWVLRELSLADLSLVVDFIKGHYHHFSREGLRYAIEKMDDGMKQELMRYDVDTDSIHNESHEREKSRKRKRTKDSDLKINKNNDSNYDKNASAVPHPIKKQKLN